MLNRWLKAFLPMLFIAIFAATARMASSEETKVWIVNSTSSECYHVDKNCRSLKAAKHPIKSVSLQEAKKMGRRACKVCSK